MDIVLVDRDGKTYATLAFKQPSLFQDGLPAHAIVGHFRQMSGKEPDWSSFAANPPFIAFFTRFMKGEAAVRPAILEKARVAPGEYVYVIDRRTRTPQGDVPFHDIIGWYSSDAAGAASAPSFAYNVKHRIVLPDGTFSSIVSDPDVHAAVLADAPPSTPKRSHTWSSLAWSIESPLGLGSMKVALDAAFEEPWGWGESRYNGDYLANRLTPEAACRIYVDDNRFSVELHFASTSADADAQLAVAKERLEKEVLPAVQARDVRVGSPVG
jgi:hypothetical protein